MREPPTYILMVWREPRDGVVWSETHQTHDHACASMHETPGEFIGAVVMLDHPNGANWAPINMVAATEAWLRDKEQEREAMLAERRAFRGDLF